MALLHELRLHHSSHQPHPHQPHRLRRSGRPLLQPGHPRLRRRLRTLTGGSPWSHPPTPAPRCRRPPALPRRPARPRRRPAALLGPAAAAARAVAPSSRGAGAGRRAAADRHPYAWAAVTGSAPVPGSARTATATSTACAAARTPSASTAAAWPCTAGIRAPPGAVSLAHYTDAQFHQGAPVARNNLMPGDLLFFSGPNAPLHHVGLYAGGNAMIHAERTGTRVARLDDVFHHPTLGPQYAGAVRPRPSG
ncbi:C40 family peptidase [Streptacidiphilus sp. 4-A2]|nr:C40 family peptidase [Streptacidiphilus sp. 4-A2]